MNLDELESAIRALSVAETARLFARFNLASLDSFAGVEVTIEDGLKNKNPLAIIEYNDGSKEAIDIIASVQVSPKSIGHPAIRIAIWRWSEILRHQRAFNFKDAYDEKLNGLLREVRQHARERYVDIATNNLKKIHNALIKASEERAISREEAFEAMVQFYALDKENTPLYIAFKWLRQDRTNNRAVKLQKLRAFLQREHVGNNFISNDRVLDFLNESAGSLYIRPKQWIAMRNAFIAWRFELDQYTVRRYFSNARAKRNKNGKGIDKRFLMPGLLKTYQLSEAENALSLPVVRCDLPDELKE